MNYVCLFVFLCITQVHASAFAQQEKVTFSAERLTVEQVFDAIAVQLKYDVFYSEDELNVKQEVVLTNKVMDIAEVLRQILGDRFQYDLVGKNIIIIPVKQTLPQAEAETLSGTVKDKDGQPLPGVTVQVKGTSIGASTDAEGKFQLKLPKQDKYTLVFSFVGMKPQEVLWKGKPLNVVMEEDAADLEEVVVTGIYSRKAESFTGSATTYRDKELKMVGNANILQSLRTLDPALNIRENNQFGSDPNRLPDMEIRGKSSVVGLKEEYSTDPNQPLFILDGFETSLETIVNLDMERVGSITILKDAASTAIYGSKAANGVVVVETKKPEAGKLRLRYTADMIVEMPDLNSYHLMNAAEKLEFERMAGVYTTSSSRPEDQLNYDEWYNLRQAWIRSGIDSYWLSEPVRTGFMHKHSFAIEGGDESMRYNVGLNYSAKDGVMKQSVRDILGGYVTLMYRKNNFSFNNSLNVDYTKTENPVIPFSSYAKANPYYRKRNDEGVAEKYLENRKVGARTVKAFNPIYDAEQGNEDKGTQFGIREQFQAEWSGLKDTRIRARFGLNKNNKDSHIFKSPELSEFDDKEETKRGSYKKNTESTFSYDGELTITYGALLGERHMINAVGGWKFNSSKTTRDAYVAIGFANDEIRNPAFSSMYEEDSKPTYGESESRGTSFYGNFGYSYDNRYQLDATIRMDGSSVFGVNRHFTTIWSTGISWNLHNEKFIKDAGWTNLFKLRASIGNPGNQNFDSYQSFTTYIYNTQLLNVLGTGVTIQKFGNPDLEWQKTLNLTVGTDISLFDNIFRLNLDYYEKRTDPVLVNVDIPASTGTTSYVTNFGKQITRGLDGRLTLEPLARMANGLNWTLTLTARHQKGEYRDIGDKMSSVNKFNQSKSLQRIYDGGSPYDIWAVRSAGIDPSTGREIFIKKDGSYSFNHDYDDEVKVGNTEPKVEGVFGTTLYYKNFSFTANFRYRIKAQVFNDALYNKVENITTANWMENQDKRAFYDRWQTAGNIAQFKGIWLVDEKAPMTDRFVQTENSLTGESFSIGYEFRGQAWIKKLYLSNLTLRAYTNDVFRVSSVKAERGIDYPFARSVSFSLSASF